MRAVAQRRDPLGWYGLERLSACPITSRVRMPKRSCSQRVSAQRGAEHRPAAHDVGVGHADVLDADRHVVEPDRVAAAHLSGTSWWIVPSRSMRKCAHTPGRSPSSTSGALAANVFHAELYVVLAVKCWTITLGSRSRATGSP